ncbi:MAG: hypothetical protein WBE34_17270 [Candidatus Nitrosopolaris sp.]
MNETVYSSETTEVLHGNDNIIKKTLETFSRVKERMVGSIDNAGPAIHIIYEPIWAGLLQLKEKGVKIRVVTEITPDNITYCKKLLEVCELRHLDGVRTNFAIADGKEALLHGVSQETDPLSQAILTTVRGLVEAQEYLFENLWKSAISAQSKIKEIEEGVRPPFIETLRDPLEIQKLGLELVKSVKQEILMLLLRYTTSGDAFLREREEEYAKKIQLLDEGIMQYGIRVRILTSKEIAEQIEKLIARQKIMRTTSRESTEGKDRGLVRIGKHGKFEIHLIDTFLQQQKLYQTKVSILIVDSKVSLVEELKAQSENNNSDGELTLATYSNSESTVLTYSSIFETLWAQMELKTQKM